MTGIFDLSFVIESRYRPFELVARGFEAVAAAGSGVGVLDLAGSSPAAPFAAVEVDVEDPAGTVVAGLATTGDEHVLGFYDPAAGKAGIEVRRAGRTRVVRRKAVALPGRFRLAFALCENRVTVLADVGEGWHPLVTERNRVAALVDLRAAETLATHRYAWGVRATAPPARVAGVRAGLFGMTGLRDPHLVQHADGTPYVRDGRVYLTATCAGLGFFQQAHWGVFRLDPSDPTGLEHVGKLFGRRGGLLLGDHAGQVVRDDEQDRWIVATSAWGDFTPTPRSGRRTGGPGVHVRHTTTTADVLHGVHLLETEATPLPTEASSWDPALTRIDGRWHVGFVESPSQDPFDFHPALAAGPVGAEWDEKLELVGAARNLHQCEGPVIARVGDDWWFLASDGTSRCYPVFDLQMRRKGRLDAPYETNIPHPQLVPLDDGTFLLVTFDGSQYAKKVMGYGGHGDVLIMRSAGPGPVPDDPT